MKSAFFRFALLGLAGLPLACEPAPSIWVDIDDIGLAPSVRTIVLAYLSTGRPEVIVIDAETGEGREDLPSLPSFGGREAFDVVVLAYEASTTELGIYRLGTIEPTSGARPRGGPLPRSEVGLYGRHVTVDALGAWVEIDAIPAWLDGFESPDIARCALFGARGFPLDHDDPFAAFVEEDADTLIGFTSGLAVSTSSTPRVYRITRDGPTEVDVPKFRSTLAGAQLLDAKRGSRGRIWISAGSSGPGRGTLLVGTWEEGFEEALPERRPGLSSVEPTGQYGNYWIRWLHVVPRAEGDLVYTLTDQGSVQVYDESMREWSTLVPEDRAVAVKCSQAEPVPNEFCGALFGHEDVIYAADPIGDGRMNRIAPEGITEEIVGESAAPAPLLIAGVWGLGPIAARADVISTSLFGRDDRAWGPIAPPFRNQRPFVTAPFFDGAVISGNFGYLMELQPGRVCASQDGVTGLDRVGRLMFTSRLGVAAYGSEFYFDPERGRVAPFHEVSELSVLTWE